MANGALLAGHVIVQDRAFISGHCLVHQFVRVGFLSMMQGGSKISKDLPPFTIAMEGNLMCGLNIVGMRRAGIADELRLELKTLYRRLFRSGKKLRVAMAAVASHSCSEPARLMLDFVMSSKRGVCSDVGWDSGEE
jgi:UDP-N-acetylglucosamine acyltransferase